MDKVEAIEAMAQALREGSRFPSGQPRMSLDKCREIALTAAEPFLELAANLNECIAELGDDEPFVVQRGPDGWEVRKMTAWKVLNQEVFADVRDQWLPIETAPRDGRPILLTYGNTVLEPDEDTHCDIGRWARDFWNVDSWCMNRGDYWPGAKYWRPLPDPPVLDEVVG